MNWPSDAPLPRRECPKHGLWVFPDKTVLSYRTFPVDHAECVEAVAREESDRAESYTRLLKRHYPAPPMKSRKR